MQKHVRFDVSQRGEITDREVFNILKMEKVDYRQDEVVSILAHLPRTKSGKIRIQEFLHLSILSEEAFKAIDRYSSPFTN